MLPGYVVTILTVKMENANFTTSEDVVSSKHEVLVRCVGQCWPAVYVVGPTLAQHLGQYLMFTGHLSELFHPFSFYII